MELITHRLSRWARERGQALAFTELSWKNDTERSLTFDGLYARTNLAASTLRAAGVGAGDRVVILAPSSLESVIAFFACLTLGAIAVPVVMPQSSRTRAQSRSLLGIVRDAEPTAVVAEAPGGESSFLEDFVRSLTELGIQLVSLSRDTATRSSPADARVEPAADTVAYLQYTSGSTAFPRGVRVTHGNVVACCEQGRDAYERELERAITWVPLYHDMGLVTGVIRPAHGGYHSVLIPAEAFADRPVRWLQAITRYRATLSSAPDFGYAYCARSVTEAECRGLDLRSWAVARSAGEVVRLATIDAFTTRFQSYGFRRAAFCPSYGLAEATLTVTSTRRGAAPRALTADPDRLRQGIVGPPETTGAGRTIVSCGAPLLKTEVRIVDPGTGADCDSGQVGEILVSGPQVAHGYWKAHTDSIATFGQAGPSVMDDHWLRTGDLGAIVGGELFVVGRIKDTIVVRGRNYYAQDIESTIQAVGGGVHPGGIAVFGCELDGEERLATAVEVVDAGRRDLPELCIRLRRAVASEHSPALALVAMVPPRNLPKTTSGKIQHSACRDALEDGSLELLYLWRAESPSASKPSSGIR
jgi:acyl-CoA synthetase (AMP-forming)/AMP-acid ligase II